MYQGQFLDDRFELKACVGEGGSGTVWLARDHRLGISVAVKMLRSALRGDTERRAEFERESELCSRMMSPHIVRVLSRGVDANDRPFIVYELLEGETLDQRILRDGPLSLEETETVVVHVSRALARAHSMSILHKDIKPGNVFLTKDDQGRLLAKVLDFGIAEISDGRSGASEAICGTLEYMPREVLVSGMPASERGDLYALTAVAYECFTGVAPFTGESVMEVVMKMGDAPASLEAILPAAAARPLDAWLRRGLAPIPGHRFAFARELTETLQVAVKQAKAALGIQSPERRSSGATRLAAPRVPSFADPQRGAPPHPTATPARDATTADDLALNESAIMRSAPTVQLAEARPTRKLARKG